MGKRTLKYGGLSGVLPKVRPVFKKYPIKPKTKEELAEEAKIEQGYAEGVPLPVRKGFTFHRKPIERPVITVKERIEKYIEDRAPKDIDESKLTPEQKWELEKDEIRRAFLKEAYQTEEKRLAKLEALKSEKLEREKKFNTSKRYEENESAKLTLPTIDSYLKGPIMRQRTEEERQILEEQLTLNRKMQELEIKERKANDLLSLYHAASNFITTEDQLEKAIYDAFEVNVSQFERAQLNLENRISGHAYAFANANTNEGLVMDEAFGEINGQPGLSIVKSTLNGNIDAEKHEARLKLNNQSN